MDIKRILTGLIGFPFIVLVFVLGNKYIIDCLMAIVAILSIHEYINCVKKKANPVSWILYLLAGSISCIHFIPKTFLSQYLGIGLICFVTVLFLHVLFTDMEINVLDISFTLIGALYIVGFTVFIPILYGYEECCIGNVGKYYIWYIIMATWGTDVFAYLVGKHFGKHKFSKISPKKSIEGCIGGALGGVALVLAYTFVLNNWFDMGINYLVIGCIGLVLSIMGQIGDFVASSFKRYSEIKDFSNLIPGHGGMIDRIDSVIFAAPFAYYLLTMLL
ncbi:MAG: phosphatidate cytidylyltransferase [Clostridia bacterium]|nr:phosphatidate cytidylyltransferase [Clostridia bacterium]